jgi:pimeloyl-ACP methyl ester carboxylesterase
MGRKIRRVVRWVTIVVVVGLLGTSLVYNAFTAPKGLAPRDAGVPGQFVETAGGLMHYETAGTGPLPVVLLHGFGEWSFTWRSTLAALGADGRFTAYAPDMRGFGFSERTPDSLYNANGFAVSVGEFIDALKLDRPILAGNSLGGDVALRVAVARPGRLRGLVLVDAASFAAPPEWQQALSRIFFIPPFNRTGLRLFVRYRLRSALASAYADPRSVNLDEVVANVRKPLDQDGAEEALIAMVRTGAPPLADATIAAVRVPTLIVWGEQDTIVDVDAGRRLNRLIAGSRLVTYPRTGHIPQEEQRERFAADLLEFSSGLAGPRQ